MDYKKLVKVTDARADQNADLTPELVARWNEYCDENNMMDDYIYSMDEFDEIMGGMTPLEIAQRIFYGHEFNPNHDYFWFNGYANLESSDWTNQYCPIDLSVLEDEDIEEDEDVDNEEEVTEE